MTLTIPSRLRTTTWVLTCAAVLGLGACAGMSDQTRDTTIGAGVGAVAGSVITGSTAGAAVGAVIGGVIGNENDKDKKK
ncbi:MAG: glycine zipper 2TM domain-containing protein [Aquabacterium sp.]|nr:glycine zipper 2TM domain-containing protein [Aquabacterium sp.]